MSTFVGLRARFVSDTAFGGPGATPALVRALDAIGWRAVRESSAEHLANDIVVLIEDCVHGHQDLSQLTFALASMLRDGGPLLDGGLPPVEAYWPAAEEILSRYVRDDGSGGSGAGGFSPEAFFS